MQIIAHRINLPEELKDVPSHYGVELDLRDVGNDVQLVHDPYKSGPSFEDYLKVYDKGLMILNIKCAEVEWRVQELVKQFNVKEYMFLDCIFPMLLALSQKGETNLAIRYSEFEGFDTLELMKGRAQWVWVDCYTKLPLDKTMSSKIKSLGYKICLVSPEVQGRPHEVEDYISRVKNEGLDIDGVCTKMKYAHLWETCN